MFQYILSKNRILKECKYNCTISPIFQVYLTNKVHFIQKVFSINIKNYTYEIKTFLALLSSDLTCDLHQNLFICLFACFSVESELAIIRGTDRWSLASQERADFLWSERVGTGRQASDKWVLHGILQTEQLKICCSLGDLGTHSQKKEM